MRGRTIEEIKEEEFKKELGIIVDKIVSWFIRAFQKAEEK